MHPLILAVLLVPHHAPQEYLTVRYFDLNASQQYVDRTYWTREDLKVVNGRDFFHGKWRTKPGWTIYTRHHRRCRVK